MLFQDRCQFSYLARNSPNSDDPNANVAAKAGLC